MSIPRPKYLCLHCLDRGVEQVVVGKIASGVMELVESDIPCRHCTAKAKEAMDAINAEAERIRTDVFSFEGVCKLLGYPAPREN